MRGGARQRSSSAGGYSLRHPGASRALRGSASQDSPGSRTLKTGSALVSPRWRRSESLARFSPARAFPRLVDARKKQNSTTLTNLLQRPAIPGQLANSRFAHAGSRRRVRPLCRDVRFLRCWKAGWAGVGTASANFDGGGSALVFAGRCRRSRRHCIPAGANPSSGKWGGSALLPAVDRAAVARHGIQVRTALCK